MAIRRPIIVKQLVNLSERSWSLLPSDTDRFVMTYDIVAARRSGFVREVAPENDPERVRSSEKYDERLCASASHEVSNWSTSVANSLALVVVWSSSW